VSLEDKQTLFAGPLARIDKVRCLRAQRGLSCAECKTDHQIGVPLSGSNVHHIGRAQFANTPSHVTLSNRGEEYRVSHPYGSGETQLTIVFQEPFLLDLLGQNDPGVVDRANPFLARQLPISTKLRLALQLFAVTAGNQTHSALELDETIVGLGERLFARESVNPISVSSRDHKLAQQTRSLLAACYAQSISLEQLATTLGVSVYHLCRVYRKATGVTLWSEIQQLRSKEALLRLQEGESDLTHLGLSLGYSHHSHFTASFRRELGLTPSAARNLLATGSLSQVRALLRK